MQPWTAPIAKSGPTIDLTLKRLPYVPAAAILDELERWKALGQQTEYVTLGGSGEPTLNSEFGEVIRGVRRILPGKPVAVLTNTTLMDDPEVRRDLALADVVLPSMDTLVPEEFRRLNRAARGLTPLGLADGLLAFRREFSGAIFLEVLLAAGYNDSEENLHLLEDYVRRLGPDRVDVVTLSRPGTLDAARAVDADTLARWRAALGATIPAPAHDRAATCDLSFDDAVERICSSLARRPQTVLQLAGGMGLSPELVNRALARLDEQGLLRTRSGPGGEYHSLRTDR